MRRRYYIYIYIYAAGERNKSKEGEGKIKYIYIYIKRGIQKILYICIWTKGNLRNPARRTTIPKLLKLAENAPNNIIISVDVDLD